MGLIRKVGKGGRAKGPMRYPLESSLLRSWVTVLGSDRADSKLEHAKL